jgi:hypothetical protein
MNEEADDGVGSVCDSGNASSVSFRPNKIEQKLSELRVLLNEVAWSHNLTEDDEEKLVENVCEDMRPILKAYEAQVDYHKRQREASDNARQAACINDLTKAITKLQSEQQQRDASHNALCDVVCDLIETTVQGDGNDVKLYANASNARVCADDYLKRAEKAETERDAMRECVEVLRKSQEESYCQIADEALTKLDALNESEWFK